jgi:hypothetical protein
MSGVAVMAAEPDRWADAVAGPMAGREALERVWNAQGGSYKLPAVEFFLFGMGPRDKFVYADGKLHNASASEARAVTDLPCTTLLLFDGGESLMCRR